MALKAADFTDLIDQGKALGIVTDNIEFRDTPNGISGFRIDQNLPVKIVIPSDLLIPLNNVNMTLGQLHEHVETKHKIFFNDYLALRFDEKQISTYESKLHYLINFQTTLRSIGISVPNEISRKGVLERIAQSYALNFRFTKSKPTIPVFMPILDLFNHHEQGGGFTRIENTELKTLALGISNGLIADNNEVFVRYQSLDSISIFNLYLFASAASRAYSIPMTLHTSPSGLIIKRDFARKVPHPRLGDIPEYTQTDDIGIISHLMIGNSHNQSAPVNKFKATMADKGLVNLNRPWSRIKTFNLKTLLQVLYEVQDSEEHPIREQLTQTIKLQIDTILSSL